MTFTTLITLLIVIVVVGVIFQIAMAASNKKALANGLSLIPNFTASHQVLGVDGIMGIAIDEQREKVCLLSLLRNPISKVIDSSALISAEIFEDGSSITKTSRASQVGGALVGGIALGGVGAIIGGLTGKTKTTEKVKRIELRLTVDDTTTPLHDVVLMNVECEKGGFIYNAAMQQARVWIGLIDVLIRRADNNKGISNTAASSIADELSKLAALRDSGILTESEFLTQKSRTLNIHDHSTSGIQTTK